jgi:hypothetical protein
VFVACSVCKDVRMLGKLLSLPTHHRMLCTINLLLYVVQGTLNYLDPAYLRSGRLTETSDIYRYTLVAIH